MNDMIKLSKLKEGVLAEIVDAEEALFNLTGIARGMSVIVLQKTVDWLVQVGADQLFLKEDVVNKIMVRPISI